MREVEDAETKELEEKIKDLGRKVDDYDRQNLKPKMNAITSRLDKMENDNEKIGRDQRELRCMVDEHKEQLMSMTGTLYNSSTKDDIVAVKD
jgi:chromosome segregation ATPase